MKVPVVARNMVNGMQSGHGSGPGGGGAWNALWGLHTDFAQPWVM